MPKPRSLAICVFVVSAALAGRSLALADDVPGTGEAPPPAPAPVPDPVAEPEPVPEPVPVPAPQPVTVAQAAPPAPAFSSRRSQISRDEADEPGAPGVVAVAAPFRVEHGAFFNCGFHSWSNVGSIGMFGIELGHNLSSNLAFSAEWDTNLDGPTFALHALRGGLRAYLSDGPISPYLVARGGELMGDGGSAAVWSLGGGAELNARPSGIVLDLGLGVVGAFKGSGTLTELSLSMGKRW